MAEIVEVNEESRAMIVSNINTFYYIFMVGEERVAPNHAGFGTPVSHVVLGNSHGIATTSF